MPYNFLSYCALSQLNFSSVGFAKRYFIINCGRKNILQIRLKPMTQVIPFELYHHLCSRKDCEKHNTLKKNKRFSIYLPVFQIEAKSKKYGINEKGIEEKPKLLEAPIIHDARKGIVYVLYDSLLKRNSQVKLKDSSPGPPSDARKAQIQKNIHSTVPLLFSDKKKLRIEDKKGHKGVSSVSSLANETPIASSQACTTQDIDIKKLAKYYASLAKSRLTGLVVLTAMAGYALAPAPFDPLVFTLCSVGTALVSSGANSINQYFEVPFDSLMDRTKNRVLVKGLLTPSHALIFGFTCGCCGLSILSLGVNEVTALLGAANLLLYTCLYTPFKRISIANTWIGSFVGAIPPMMGWAACTGSLEPGAWIIGGLLYAWQFPHFNALSWNLQPDYKRAGYKMMSVSHPELCRETALKYSALIILLSFLAPVFDVTTWTFAFGSSPLNVYFTYLAWRFYEEADSKSSRKLFRFSLVHLPALLAFMIFCKKSPKKSDKEIVKESL